MFPRLRSSLAVASDSLLSVPCTPIDSCESGCWYVAIPVSVPNSTVSQQKLPNASPETAIPSEKMVPSFKVEHSASLLTEETLSRSSMAIDRKLEMRLLKFKAELERRTLRNAKQTILALRSSYLENARSSCPYLQSGTCLGFPETLKVR
jgi:hypothetical protein